MKNSENQRLLDRKRSIDRERQAQAILKAQYAARQRRVANLTAMSKVANAAMRPMDAGVTS